MGVVRKCLARDDYLALEGPHLRPVVVCHLPDQHELRSSHNADGTGGGRQLRQPWFWRSVNGRDLLWPGRGTPGRCPRSLLGISLRSVACASCEGYAVEVMALCL